MSDPALRLQGYSSTAGVCGAQLWQGLPDKPTALAWHPSNASTLAFGCEDGGVGLFDVGASIGAVFAARHAGPVIAVAWQRAGPVRQRLRADGKPEQGKRSAGEAEPSNLAGGEPGRGNGSAEGSEMAPTLLTLGEDGRLLSWGALDMKGQALARSAAAPAAPLLQGSPTDLLQAGALPRPAGPAEQVTALSVHPYRCLLATGLVGGTVAIYGWAAHSVTGAGPALESLLLVQRRQHTGAVSCLAWCPECDSSALEGGDGTQAVLASAGADGCITCWRLDDSGVARIHARHHHIVMILLMPKVCAADC